jgi:ABC-type protease/lipase transport system fused ATPase/permease subunit
MNAKKQSDNETSRLSRSIKALRYKHNDIIFKHTKQANIYSTITIRVQFVEKHVVWIAFVCNVVVVILSLFVFGLLMIRIARQTRSSYIVIVIIVVVIVTAAVLIDRIRS